MTGIHGGVSNHADLDRLVALIKRGKGKLDALFANASIANCAPLRKITEDLNPPLRSAAVTAPDRELKPNETSWMWRLTRIEVEPLYVAVQLR